MPKTTLFVFSAIGMTTKFILGSFGSCSVICHTLTLSSIRCESHLCNNHCKMHHNNHHSPKDSGEMTSSKKEQTTLSIFLYSLDLVQISSLLASVLQIWVQTEFQANEAATAPLVEVLKERFEKAVTTSKILHLSCTSIQRRLFALWAAFLQTSFKTVQLDFLQFLGCYSSAVEEIV